jgi:hypothetical protein
MLLYSTTLNEWDPLRMDYFDKFDNESLNTYKKIIDVSSIFRLMII